MEKLKLFECYAGYGGASFGLKKANIPFECVGYSEINEKVIDIYNKNHANITNYGDITKIDIKDLPNFDLITGGFPCQDVSIAGLRDLQKGRTKTVFKMLDIIKEKKPTYCLLENVEGILTILNGELLREIVRQLKSMGYAVSYELLKSKDYGTPQKRPRVWIAAELNKQPFGFNPFPKKEELTFYVKDILEKEVDKKYFPSEKMLDYWKTRVKDWSGVIEEVFPTLTVSKATLDNNWVICHSRYPRTGNPKKGGTGQLSCADGTSYTIDCGNSQFIETFEKGFRYLTPKECFRLMGFFNDEIDIEGFSDTQLYKAAGNGWDVNLVSKIFKKWFTNK